MNDDSKVIESHAHRLRELHSEILGACQTVLSKAIEAGGILHDVKAGLPHGEFTSWVERNAGFSVRTAQRYMKIHDNRDQINDSVSLLTDAHRLLTTSKPTLSDDEKRLMELEAIIDRGLQKIADAGVDFNDFLSSYLGVSVEEFLVLIKLAEDEDKEKMLRNYTDLCSNVHDFNKRGGWKALGYKSFQECAEAEFKKKPE